MPTYEYRCRGCSERFDRFQKITDPPIEKCPQCGGPVERLISGGSGMLFKGPGFYTTDYRSANYRKAAEKEKSPDAKTSSTTVNNKKPLEEKKNKVR